MSFTMISFLIVMMTYIPSSVGQFMVLSDCVCPGHELRLECTTVGGGSTVWKGSALECPSSSNEIVLFHYRFETGKAEGWCSNNRIMGRGINTTSDSDGIKYISQLIIQLDVNDSLDGRTVQCIHDNYTSLPIVIGSHTIAYSRDPPPPPEAVRLSEVDGNGLEYTWDPVQTACPVSVEYKVTAMNCGVCPTATHNTSITCVVDDVTTVIDNLCILSIQSVVCGVTGENRSNVTATLRVPGALKLRSVLPYYNSTSRELRKIVVQVMTDSSDDFIFSISEGIDGSVSTYTFNLTYSNSECGHISKTIPVSSCKSGVWSYAFSSNTVLHCFDDSSQVIVNVFASNILGDGVLSDASRIDISNNIFYAQFETLSNMFSCKFFGIVLKKKSCIIKYGIVDISKQSCDIINETRNSSDKTLTDTVTVLISTLPPNVSEFCFIAIGETASFIIAVEGTFSVQDHSEILNTTSNFNLQLVISVTVCIPLLVVVVLVFLILIGLFSGVLRKRKQSLNRGTEQNYYQSSFVQQEIKQETVSSADNLIYSEVNMIQAGESMIRPVIVDDNKVEYSEINHRGIVATNKEYEDTTESSFMRQETKEEAVGGAVNLVYSQIKIVKAGNNTCPVIVDDDKVQYAELNHHANRHGATNKDYQETAAADELITLDSLLFQLRPQVTSEWYKFGLALEISEEVLNKYLGYPSEECIVEMLDYWLRNHGSKPTWKEVAKALKDINLHQLADDILKVYTAGKLPVEVDMDGAPQMTPYSLESEKDELMDCPPPLPPKQ